LGSHAGKAALAAAYGISSGVCLFFQHPYYLIDPIFDYSNLEAWKHSVQGHPDNSGWAYTKEDNFYNSLREKIAIVSERHLSANLVGSYSELEIPKHNNIAYCFSDADSHQDGMPLREVKLLEDRMIKGGIIAFHDFGNQFCEPKEAAEYLISTGKYDWVDIDWEQIFYYVKENNLEEGNNSWHLYPDLPHSPNFVGAVKRK